MSVEEAEDVAVDPVAAPSDVSERLEAIEQAVVRLGVEVAAWAGVAEHKSALIDRLYEENQRLRTGELREAVMPLLRELMGIADDAARLAETSGEGSDAALLRDALLDALERGGLQRFVPEAGIPFDAKANAVRGAVDTDQPALDRTVASVLRPGFRREDGSIIRVAEVQIHHHVDATGGEES